jgi:hypothetical protein
LSHDVGNGSAHPDEVWCLYTNFNACTLDTSKNSVLVIYPQTIRLVVDCSRISGSLPLRNVKC